MKTDNIIMETDYRIQVLNHFYFIKKDTDWYNYRDGLLGEIECWCERRNWERPKESRELKIPKIDDLPFSLNSDIKQLPPRFHKNPDGTTVNIWDEISGKSCIENCIIINKYNTSWLFDLFIEDIDFALNKWFNVHPELFLN